MDYTILTRETRIQILSNNNLDNIYVDRLQNIIELLKQVNADAFEMSTWLQERNQAVNTDEHITTMESLKNLSAHKCGTSACLAGWTATLPDYREAFLAGDLMDCYVDEISFGNYLNITDDFAYLLTTESATYVLAYFSLEPEEPVESLRLELITAEMVVLVLDEILAFVTEKRG